METEKLKSRYIFKNEKMKKLTLCIVFMLTVCVGLINAQTNQGKVLLGLSSPLSIFGTGSDLMIIGFSSIKEKSDADGFEDTDTYKMTNINLLPKVGYFVVDNLALGLDLNIAFLKHQYGESSTKYSQTLFCAGPFIRYYIPLSKVLSFFELNSSFGAMNDKTDYQDNTNYEDQENKFSVMSVGGGIGLAAPLGERITFDVVAGYNSFTLKEKEDNEDNERTVIGNLGLKIGFTILLGSNKL